MRIITLVMLVIIVPRVSYAEIFDIHPASLDYALLGDEEKKDVNLSMLNQANILRTNSVKKVRVNALKYYLGIGDDKWVPFYVFTTNPTETKKTIENTVDSLLDTEGGVINLNIGIDKKITPFDLFKFKSPQEGLFIYGNGGAKWVEGVSETIADSKKFWVEYVRAEIKLQLPLGDNPISTTNRVGGLKLGLDATLNHASSDGYLALFSESPDKTFYSVNGIASFWLTNQIYMTVEGTIYSSENQVDKRTCVSVSLAQ